MYEILLTILPLKKYMTLVLYSKKAESKLSGIIPKCPGLNILLIVPFCTTVAKSGSNL